jgi:serine/threonine protein phosphatase PrpC
MKLVAGARSDVGLVRQGKPNEDSYLMEEPIFAVADGMGGHIAGDVASSTAVEVIAGSAGAADAGDPSSLAALVRRANSAIWEKAQADPSLRGMGTTCTLMMIEDSTAHVAHVGDSRAYLLRGSELSQLTEDHTLVGRMVREGRLTPDEAEHHPQRNIITRVLGVDSDVQVDIYSFDLVAGDRLLLCSDGLSSMLDAETIRQALAQEGDAQRAADKLVELANNAGGEDNITVVVLDLLDSETSSAHPPADSAKAVHTGPMPAAGEASAHRADTPVEPAPSASSDTVLPTTTDTRPPQPRPRFWLRRLAATVVVLGILVVAGVLVIRWQLGNSYFVGVDDDGLITIFRGRPEDVAGISLRSEEEQTQLAIEELPEFMRDEVEQGISADSLTEARERVETLEAQAESFRQEGRGDRNGNQ